MNFIALVTITTLFIAGVFHFYWAFGGTLGLDRAIPTKDGKALLNPGKLLTIIVGFIILNFAWVAYVLNFKDLSVISYSEQIVYAGWFLSGVFAIRSIGDFRMVGLFKKINSTKFAEFDTKYFIPLTSFWAITFALLAYQV
ncbi:MAG: DUF3995 domain-containing protein [Sulfurimonas sp.]|nr:DUF3995 domain-containing protein [Sulfurimonas sp.]